MRNLLEHLIQKAGEDLAAQQICRIYKAHEAWTKTPCDFFGFTRMGRAILIEAKQVKRLSLPTMRKPGLLPHQYVALSEANRAGALALLCWAREGICATLSWDLVLDLSKDRKSIPWRSIPQTYLVPIEACMEHPSRLLRRWLPG